MYPAYVAESVRPKSAERTFDQMPSAPISRSPSTREPSSSVAQTPPRRSEEEEPPPPAPSSSSKPTTCEPLTSTPGPPMRSHASARIRCSVNREITRVTGRPASAARWNMSNLTYQSPDAPSQRPLTRSPVMTPSASTSSATAASSASSAASAFDWTWIGPRYLPSPRMAVRSRSRTRTSMPFLRRPTARTRPGVRVREEREREREGGREGQRERFSVVVRRRR